MTKLDERIEEARELLDSAGWIPWQAIPAHGSYRIVDDDGTTVAGTFSRIEPDREGRCANLIAAAVNLLPDLLAERDRLLAERDRLLAVAETARDAAFYTDKREPLPAGVEDCRTPTQTVSVAAGAHGALRAALARLDSEAGR